MTHAGRLKRSACSFRPLTGITPAEFEKLLATLTPLHQQAEVRRLERPGRRRRPGAGRKHLLALEDRLLMLLIYYRTYVTHAFLGFLFGIDQSSVCRQINPLQPLLAGIFRIPERRVTLEEDELRALFFDGVDQPIHRPGRGQRRYYTRKRKRHVLKHQIVVVRRRKPPGPAGGGGAKPRRQRVAAVSPAFGGRVHDKRVYDLTRAVVPPGVPCYGDTAYLGVRRLWVPVRKPPGGQLTRRQKQGNRRLARKRVAVEHGIGKMKIWRIAAERYRNPRRRHTLMMKNIAGLHNLMFA
jgi:hypothetical protein